MKRKSIKENETRVNKLINQFTYNLQRKKTKRKKQTNKQKQNKTNLLDSPNLKRKEKETGEAFEN